MKKIFTITSLFLFTLSLQATIRTVSNTPSTLAQFSTINAAIAASVSGDTIYVHGSPNAYAAFTLTNKNNVVSSSINDSLIHTPNGVSGVFFKVGGNAATAKQFFLSDTNKNFIRGALYFDVTPNADSLKPVQDFLQADMDHIINTFKWTNK